LYTVCDFVIGSRGLLSLAGSSVAMKGALCALAFACLLASSVIGAEEGSEDPTHVTVTAPVPQHPLTNMPRSADGVTTVDWFPYHSNKQFPAGEDIDVIVGFHNSEKEALNVTAIMGSINAKEQFSTYYQNLTFQRYFTLVNPNEEGSFQYTFRPDPNMPPREFQVALTVFYQSAKEGFSSTFFNSTIDITEPKKWFDSQLIQMCVTIAVMLCGAGFLLYRFVKNLGFVKKVSKKGRKPEAAAKGSEPDQNEWLKGTYYGAASKPKQRTAKVTDIKSPQR
jgi:translocon-associated protein subunit alpha